MGKWIEEAGLRWRGLSPLGAEVAGDLSAPLSDEATALLRRLLWEHGLILARGQALSMERQREICAAFGPILLREGENGYLATNGDADFLELSWHADAAYTNAPFDAIALHAVDVIDEGSSTAFVDARTALATLPAAIAARLPARQEMISPAFDRLGQRACDVENPLAMKRSEQPVIFANPHDGSRCLWVSELQSARLIGLPWPESRDLLHATFEHLYRPQAVYEHFWRNGDLVIWDNIATQHTRRPQRVSGRRVLQRVIVGTAGAIPMLGDMADPEAADQPL